MVGCERAPHPTARFIEIRESGAAGRSDQRISAYRSPSHRSGQTAIGPLRKFELADYPIRNWDIPVDRQCAATLTDKSFLLLFVHQKKILPAAQPIDFTYHLSGRKVLHERYLYDDGIAEDGA